MSDLTQWTYKRSHSITSGTTLTDYQVKIRVYRTEGTSTGDTVYLGSKCLADYGDIRFVASDDTTELSYWMETNAGTYADFWVKVGSITSKSSIYIYYGNSSATTTSNGDATFEFFDDFDDNDITDWTIVSGSWSATGGQLVNEITQIHQYIRSPYSTDGNFRVLWNAPSNFPGICVYYTDYNNHYFYFPNDGKVYRKVSGSYTVIGTLSTNARLSIYKDGANTNISDGTTVITSSQFHSGYVAFDGFDSNDALDWIAIAKYAATEPTQTPGSEIQLKNPLDDWTYKRSHTLTGDSLTDYQVKVLVNYSSGTSSGDTVYLDGKCKADFGDIRFTDNDENEIPYWIESISGTVATIWIKVPSISDTTIWIYYGNASASTTSNGDTTFEFFSDGSTIAGWTGSTEALSVTNGKLSLSSASGSLVFSTWSAGSGAVGYAIQTKCKFYGQSASYGSYIGYRSTDASNEDRAELQYSSGYNRIRTNSRTTWNPTYTTTNIDTSENIYELQRYTGAFRVYKNNILMDGTNPITTTLPTGTDYVYMYSKGGASYKIELDWILVRKYISTEPTHGDWSTEQEVTTYPLRITITPTSGTDPLSVSYNLSISEALDNFTLSYGDGQEYTGDDITTFSTTHTYNTPGTYTVWTEGYTEFATHAFYEIPYGITVNSQAVTTSFSYDQNNNIVQFTDTSTGDVNEWYWTFGDGSHSYEQNPSHTYTSAGTYTVTLYSSNQYQYGFYSTEITVNTITYGYPPIPNFKPSYLNVITDNLPYSVQFTDLSFPTTGCTYYWSFGDTSSSTSQNPLHSYASLGIYDVSLTVTNDYGSSTITYEDCIKIHNEAKIFKEDLTYNDEFSTFGIMLFIETPSYSDIFIKAKVFTDNCYYTQGEFPSDPGIDEYCNLSFYSNINEYCETLFDNVTDYLKRIIIDPVMSVLGFQKLKMKEFTETVYYDDVLLLEPPT